VDAKTRDSLLCCDEAVSIVLGHMVLLVGGILFDLLYLEQS
jgi:hypothetical protein